MPKNSNSFKQDHNKPNTVDTYSRESPEMMNLRKLLNQINRPNKVFTENEEKKSEEPSDSTKDAITPEDNSTVEASKPKPNNLKDDISEKKLESINPVKSDDLEKTTSEAPEPQPEPKLEPESKPEPETETETEANESVQSSTLNDEKPEINTLSAENNTQTSDSADNSSSESTIATKADPIEVSEVLEVPEVPETAEEDDKENNEIERSANANEINAIDDVSGDSEVVGPSQETEHVPNPEVSQETERVINADEPRSEPEVSEISENHSKPVAEVKLNENHESDEVSEPIKNQNVDEK